MPPVKLGLHIYPQVATWEQIAAVVRRADELGFDSLWTWDHLVGIGAGGTQDVFEAWTTISALAAMTTRPTVGLLVTANTFRNPGLIAKSAVTVDHVSGGRFVLGLGAAYRELEHELHGIDFGSGFGERLDWLAESVAAIRALLAGQTVSSPPAAGTRARHDPDPDPGRRRAEDAPDPRALRRHVARARHDRDADAEDRAARRLLRRGRTADRRDRVRHGQPRRHPRRPGGGGGGVRDDRAPQRPGARGHDRRARGGRARRRAAGGRRRRVSAVRRAGLPPPRDRLPRAVRRGDARTPPRGPPAAE